MASPRAVREFVLSAGAVVLLAALLVVGASSAYAQSQRTSGPLYVKLGGGLSDYTSDISSWRPMHPFGGQKFVQGAGLPFVFVGELGYQFSPSWALGIGIQGGNYPVEVYPEIEGISDSYRYAPQLLGRYTFSGGTVAPYVDLGIHATLGGDRPPTSIGGGPSVGGGLDIQLSRTASFYVESRFNLTFPDGAVDGAEPENRFDVTGQLLGFGLKVQLTTPTPPRIVQVDGPTTVQTDTAVTFAATVNAETADRPLNYRWEFGDGEAATGRTVTHTYDRPGSYVVSFSARNKAGTASQSIDVTVERPTEPPRIATVRAVPAPVAAGDSVHFSAAVTGSDSLAYEWRFGDGASAAGASPTHTYEAPGMYTARLRVSNRAGTDARTATVRVARPAEENEEDSVAAEQGPTGPAEVAPSDEAQETWSIVVASMTEESQAAAVARQYREQFSESLRVQVVAAEGDRGTRRYRVAIGAFGDADAAQQVLTERADDLPSGAWLLRLE